MGYKTSADTISFGVEIECFLPVQFVRQHGISIGRWHNGHELPSPPFPEYWRIERDSSVEINSGEYEAVELVSPVLQGAEGMREVMRVCALLQDAGALVNKTCGAHVHVSSTSIIGQGEGNNVFDSLSHHARYEFLQQVFATVTQHELALYAASGLASRIHNKYCATVKGQWSPSIRNLDSVRSYVDDKYRVLNIRNFWRSGTLEFRVFAGAIAPVRWLSYIGTAIGICQLGISLDAAVFNNDKYSEQSWVDELVALQKRLGWRGGGELLGFPLPIWDEYGKAVLDLQQTMATIFNDEAPNTDNAPHIAAVLEQGDPQW